MNKEIVAKKVKLNKGIKLLENKNFIIEEYNQYAKSTKNISKILGYVEHLADSLDIRTSNIKPGQVINKGYYQEHSIELRIEGRFPDIVKFLSGVLNPPGFVTVKRFDIRKTTENPSILQGTIVFSKILI